jgi:2'-hydroxyisoflavone reductase
MRLLVLGGGRFVGYAVAAAGVRRGWRVSVFNRGLSGVDGPGVEVLRGDRGAAADVERLVAAGPWDAVVDTSGFVPRDVLGVCQRLSSVVGRYVFVSTVSVYAGWPVRALSEDSEVLACPADAGPEFGDDVEDGPTRYGYQKAGCERAVLEVFGAARTTVVRPGVLLGPREYVGRLPWWLRRVAAGGRVVAPGDAGRSVQPADVRDLADFVMSVVDKDVGGLFNVAAPVGLETFGGMLDACRQATGSGARFVWVPDEVLLAQGVRQWSEMPLWRTFPGVWQVDAGRALRAGLSCRPLAETVRGTWEWMSESNGASGDERAGEIGLSREREQAILAAAAGR